MRVRLQRSQRCNLTMSNMEPVLPWVLFIILQLPHGLAYVNIAQFETQADCEESAKASLDTWRQHNPLDTTTAYKCQADPKHSA